jgi:hypothetical protein
MPAGRAAARRARHPVVCAAVQRCRRRGWDQDEHKEEDETAHVPLHHTRSSAMGNTGSTQPPCRRAGSQTAVRTRPSISGINTSRRNFLPVDRPMAASMPRGPGWFTARGCEARLPPRRELTLSAALRLTRERRARVREQNARGTGRQRNAWRQLPLQGLAGRSVVVTVAATAVFVPMFSHGSLRRSSLRRAMLLGLR